MYQLPIDSKETLLVSPVQNAFNVSDIILPRVKEFDLNIEAGIDKDTGDVVSFDLTKTPHLIIGGTTGSGKSEFVNTIITSLLLKNSPWEVEFIMIDPKRLGLSVYANIPHLICEIIKKEADALKALEWLSGEMDNRYEIMEQYNVSGIEELRSVYQIKSLSTIVCVIDEFSQLMMGSLRKEIEEQLVSLAQMGRAAGIHLVLATQSPRKTVISGLMQSNFPSRAGFQVSSSSESKIVFDKPKVGAENLLGRGDMFLSLASSRAIVRVQSAIISKTDTKNIVSFIKSQYSANYYRDVLGKNVSTVDVDTAMLARIEADAANYARIYDEELQKILSEQNSSKNSYMEMPKPESDSKILAEALDLCTYTDSITVTQLSNRFYITYDKAEKLARKLIKLGAGYRKCSFHSVKSFVGGVEISFE